jgi:hypothetical protein
LFSALKTVAPATLDSAAMKRVAVNLSLSNQTEQSIDQGDVTAGNLSAVEEITLYRCRLLKTIR